MSGLTKRHLLAALLALGAAPGLASAQGAGGPLSSVDIAGAKAIGAAYLQRHPGTAASLESALFPKGWTADAVAALGSRVTADFRRGAQFEHEGWRLAQTEAQLMALLSLR